MAVYGWNFRILQTIDAYQKSTQQGKLIRNFFKGELQRQNKLISSERPFKILQNETKIIKIGQAVLEIFNFKNWDLDNFTRKNDRKTENVAFLEVLQKLKNNILCDVRNDKCTIQQ